MNLENPYGLNKAQEEASKMQEKIKSDQAKDYAEAEKLIDYENNEAVDKTKDYSSIDQTKEPEKLTNCTGRELGATGTAYANSLSSLVTGKWDRYLGKDDPQNPESYEKIKKIMGAYLAAEYKMDNPGLNKEVSDYFKNILKDKEVLDLGAGMQGMMYNVANFCRAKKYTGVEKYFAECAYEYTKKFADEDDNPIPFEIIQKDMIEFLQSNQQKYDVIFLMGIDEHIVPEERWPRLMEEIKKHLNDDGYLLLSGGFLKPWDIIKKYFKEDEDTEYRLKQTIEKPIDFVQYIPDIMQKRK